MIQAVRRFVFAAVCVSSSVAGAAQSATPEDLELFRNLTPEQQEAVLESMAGRRTDAVEAATANRQSRESSDNRRIGTTEPSNERRAGAAPSDTRSDARADRLPSTLGANDTVLVQVVIDEEDIEPANLDALQDLRDLVLARNPYRLDRQGMLNLPGFPGIMLGGLTEFQAAQRLSADAALREFSIQVRRLPVTRTGIEGLKPFGYDLFDNAPSTFSPVTDVPVPADYVIGPGDELHVQLFGSQNRNLRLTVSRDGAVSFPELGPISIGGMGFNAARQVIESRVAQQMIGVQASVSMGETRAIRVFVLGEARLQGSYTVSGLATMTTALFASGGVNSIGSLRDIQLKRQGQVVRRLDLYDLLIRGDTSDDAKLLPGDVIFIPPVGPTVSVDGEVRRPAIYELRDEASVADVVRIAGGLTPEADPSRISLTRIDASMRRLVADVSLGGRVGADQRVGNGDILQVARLRPQLDSGVRVEGFVYRPGVFAWRAGMHLTDVIGSVEELKDNADLNYVLVRRESGADRRISGVSADLAAALAAPGGAADLVLEPRDRIFVFDLAPGRERIIQPLLEELRLQSRLSRPTEVVQVTGRVRAPGSYPLEPGMRISDLLRAGGGLGSGAYGAEAELTRYSIDDSGARITELLSVDLAAAARGDSAANITLQSDDYLMIKETPSWTSQESVTLRGEVRFPGTYPIRRGETLYQVLERAGGPTAFAFLDGSAFTRRDLRAAEQAHLERLAQRMRSDLAALSLQAANVGRADTSQALISGQSLLEQLQTAEATGRYVIDLPGLLEGGQGGPKDVLLRHGDTLLIPKLRQEVTVIGEIQNPTSHQFLPDIRRDEYIAMSGGTTAKADKGRVYIVRADGRVATRSGSVFSRQGDNAIRAGDTIVVPLDTERMPRLPFWQAVTQILYQLAVSVAAVNSF